jgi:gamma-tubulin complex component 3
LFSLSCEFTKQSFCAALQNELNDYYRLLATLDAQLNKSAEITTATAEKMTLKRLYAWLQTPLQRLRLLSVLIDGCSGNLLMHHCIHSSGYKGGALLSQIYACTEHGDPFVRRAATQLLRQVYFIETRFPYSRPLNRSLT